MGGGGKSFGDESGMKAQTLSGREKRRRAV